MNCRTILWSFIGLFLYSFVTSCAAQNAATGQIDYLKESIARDAADILRRIEEVEPAIRPRKTFITPSTRSVGHAFYYKDVQRRLEEIGTRDFPQKNGKKMYGEMVVRIPIYQDGSLFMRDGGARIEKSSGNADLDEAALAIVRSAAPFGHFPSNLLSAAKDDLWIIITRFSFTQGETLEAPVKETR